jgi:hypothetical protein
LSHTWKLPAPQTLWASPRGRAESVSKERQVHGSWLFGGMSHLVCLCLWLCWAVVRNIFKILGYHERDNTTQKSTDKAIFTSAEGCTPEV